MYPELTSKTVVVTGAGGLIGRSICQAFAEEQARVICSDVDIARAEQTARACGGIAVRCDVSDEQSVESLFETLEGVDVLINNAGIFPNRPLFEMSLDEWDAVFAVNARGTFLCTRAVTRRMIARKTRGAIVCISSVAGSTQARRGAAHYCASKAAVDMFVRVAAIELGIHGIRINAIAPGTIRAETMAPPGPTDRPFLSALLEAIPLGHSGAADDVARSTIWLASQQASWITGAILPVTGGAHVGAPHLPFSDRRSGGESNDKR